MFWRYGIDLMSCNAEFRRVCLLSCTSRTAGMSRPLSRRSPNSSSIPISGPSGGMCGNVDLRIVSHRRRFEQLIEKEWLRFGHPFSSRHSHSGMPGSQAANRAPVFMLFLDCVWQVCLCLPVCLYACPLSVSMCVANCSVDLSFCSSPLTIARSQRRTRVRLNSTRGSSSRFWTTRMLVTLVCRLTVGPAHLTAVRHISVQLRLPEVLLQAL
jgi:hypothetical protein